MFGKRFHLFTILGFKVGIDVTWLLLAVLVAWSLAAGLFPAYYEGFSRGHLLVDGDCRRPGSVHLHRLP